MSIHTVATLAARVTATITEYRLEKDGDVHLILSDSGCTMIAEVKDTSLWVRDFHATSHWKECGTRYVITGLLHFDHEHGQRGAAPNQIEIHPIISLWPVKQE